MKKFRVIGLLLLVVMLSTLLEGCFRKGENDPFISFRSRQARMSGNWTMTEFTGDYLLKLPGGENRKILLKQNGTSISETTEYINMSPSTQDSLTAGQDTTIEWKGKIIEAIYNIREDGTFNFAYEYTLDKTHSKYYENGKPTPTTPFFPAYSEPYTMDSTMTRNYKTEHTGRWNFLDDVDGYKNRERVIFEIENSIHITNYAVTYVCDAEDDEGKWSEGNPVDTSFSHTYRQSTNHKYANGEKSILWELDKLKNLEVTMVRSLDHIHNYSLTFPSDTKLGADTTSSSSRKGSEFVELEQSDN